MPNTTKKERAELPFLETKQLTKELPNRQKILSSISLSLEKGSFVVLAGRNGAGKTQLIRHLNGLLRPSSGEVLFRGIPISKNIKEIRQKVGLVFQSSDAGIVAPTVWKDTAFGPENLALPQDEVAERVEKALCRVGLNASFYDRHPFTLSGGEKRRLALAGVLAMGAEAIILDEPFIGLDFLGVTSLIRCLIELHNQGRTLLVVTHDLEKILAHAEQLLIMEKGEMLRQGNPGELLEDLLPHGIRRPPGRVDQMSWIL